MAGKARKGADYKAFVRYVVGVGATVAQASTLSSISESTAYRFMASPRGKRAMARARREKRDAISDQAALGASEALVTLRTVNNDIRTGAKARADKIRAAKVLLDFFGRNVADAELSRRVDALEEVAGGQ